MDWVGDNYHKTRWYTSTIQKPLISLWGWGWTKKVQYLDTECMDGLFVDAIQLCTLIKVNLMKSYEIPPQITRHVLLITHLLSIQMNTMKMMMNNKVKAKTLIGNPAVNWHCFEHVMQLWPLSMLDRKQVRGYVTYVMYSLMGIELCHS